QVKYLPLAIAHIPGLEPRRSRTKADSRGRAGVLAMKLSNLPLACQEPDRIAHRRFQSAYNAVRTRGRFDAIPIGDAWVAHDGHCLSLARRDCRIGSGQSAKRSGDNGIDWIGGKKTHWKKLAIGAETGEVHRAHARQIEGVKERLFQKV